MSYAHIGFSSQCNTVCTVHTTFFDIVGPTYDALALQYTDAFIEHMSVGFIQTMVILS